MFFDINSVVEGRYYPGTFILGIDKCFYEEMQYSSFTKEEMATLAHEYIHYLQDISTIFGAMNFQHRVKLLQLYFALAQQAEKIQIPIKLDACGVDNAYAQTELMSFYDGDHLEKKIHHVNKVVIENEEMLDETLDDYSDYHGERTSKVSIYFDDKDVPTMFGANYIIESMAYLIEYNCFGAEKRVNEFPYNACEMLCSILYPDFLKVPENIVILCELALMHEHSGLQFYSFLKQLKQTKIDFSDSDILIKYLDKTMSKSIEKLENINESVNKNIDFIFPTNIASAQMANMYVKTMFEAGYKWRKQYHFFVTEIFQERNPVDKLKQWMETFPVPMFVDGVKKEFYGGMDGLGIIPVPLSILEYFTKPEQGCPLIDYCQHSGIDSCNRKICEKTPWLQCEKEQLCPLALYFTVYGLNGKEFEIISNKHN